MLKILKNLFRDPVTEMRIKAAKAMWADEERKGEEWKLAQPLCKALIDEAHLRNIARDPSRPTVVIHDDHPAVAALKTTAAGLGLPGLKLMGFPVETSADGPKEGFTFKD